MRERDIEKQKKQKKERGPLPHSRRKQIKLEKKKQPFNLLIFGVLKYITRERESREAYYEWSGSGLNIYIII